MPTYALLAAPGSAPSGFAVAAVAFAASAVSAKVRRESTSEKELDTGVSAVAEPGVSGAAAAADGVVVASPVGLEPPARGSPRVMMSALATCTAMAAVSVGSAPAATAAATAALAPSPAAAPSAMLGQRAPPTFASIQLVP